MAKSLKVWSGSAWLSISTGDISTDDFLTTAAAASVYFPISSSVSNFGTIKTIPTTEDVVADLITDELTFAAENGIILNATASVDRLTVSTNATWNNTASAIVMRDGGGAFNISRINFDLTASVSPTTGQLFWNFEEGTLDLGMNGNVVQSIGMEFYMPPTKNDSGVEIPNGAFVMATGAQGDRITIAKAITNGTIDPEYMIGVATETIANGSENGLVTTNGIVRDINTASYAVGTLLYPDPSIAGGLTDVEPIAPNIRTPIAIVLRQHENTGRIYVRMVNSHLLEETHNIKVISASDNDIIAYNSASSIWFNQNLATAIQEIDGTGSGIDADLLDGLESTHFLSAASASSIYSPLNTSINTQTGTSYTLVATDTGKLIEMNNAAANTVIIPLNSSVPFSVGTKIDLIQIGAGQTTASAVSGVTINSEGGKRSINAQWQAVTLFKRDTDSWVLIGALKE